jgi:hypothetical protein
LLHQFDDLFELNVKLRCQMLRWLEIPSNSDTIYYCV